MSACVFVHEHACFKVSRLGKTERRKKSTSWAELCGDLQKPPMPPELVVVCLASCALGPLLKFPTSFLFVPFLLPNIVDVDRPIDMIGGLLGCVYCCVWFVCVGLGSDPWMRATSLMTAKVMRHMYVYKGESVKYQIGSSPFPPACLVEHTTEV